VKTVRAAKRNVTIERKPEKGMESRKTRGSPGSRTTSRAEGETAYGNGKSLSHESITGKKRKNEEFTRGR